MSEPMWQKSSFSEGGADTCVEVAASGVSLLVRESDDPETVLTTTPTRLSSLLNAVRSHALDGHARSNGSRDRGRTHR